MIQIVDNDIPLDWYNAIKSSPVVGMDIETSGLNKYTDRIAMVQIFVPDIGTIMVRNFDNPPIRLIDVLESTCTKKIFHHAPFDLTFLVRDYKAWPLHIADTRIAAKILDPRRMQFKHPITQKGSHALIALVHHYFNDLLDKSVSVSNWFQDTLTQEQLNYAEKDVCYLPELLRLLEAELVEHNLLRLARDAYRHIPTYVTLAVKKYDGVYEYS